MDPISIMVASQAGALLLGALGKAMAAGDEAKARELYAQIAQQYGEDMAQKIQAIKPEQMQASAFEAMKVPTEGRDAQMRALRALEAEAAQAGWSPADKAAVMQAQNAAAARASGDAASAMQALAQRGQAGSPMAAGVQMAAGQNATNALAANSLQAERDAMQRRLQSIEAAGQFGGQVRQGDYQQASDKARAQDAISQFNTSSRWAAQQERDRMEMERNQQLAAARAGQAGGYQQAAQSTGSAFGGAGQGLSTAGSAWAQYEDRKNPYPGKPT